jgi:septal ring factor EnvC (AmiA/AmiB activator)
MLQAATPEFALSALPPGKTEAEQKLVQLIDECAEEKKEVEAQLEILQGLLQKMKDNDQTLRNLDAELKASQKGKETVENVQEQVEKLKTEIKKLKVDSRIRRTLRG